MAKLLSMFLLQLLSGTFRPCLLQSPSTDLKSVLPGENVTLFCNVTADFEISWYHQSSEEMKLLITAGRKNLDKQFFLSYNVDEDHYDRSENTSSVDLVIKGVNKADSGLYFCGGRNQKSLLHFGRGIRLNFAGEDPLSYGPSQHSHSHTGYWTIIVILTTVCVVQLSIICLCVLCYGEQGKSCGESHSVQKEVGFQDVGLHHSAVTSEAADQTYPHWTSGLFTVVIYEEKHRK